MRARLLSTHSKATLPDSPVCHVSEAAFDETRLAHVEGSMHAALLLLSFQVRAAGDRMSAFFLLMMILDLAPAAVEFQFLICPAHCCIPLPLPAASSLLLCMFLPLLVRLQAENGAL